MDLGRRWRRRWIPVLVGALIGCAHETGQLPLGGDRECSRVPDLLLHQPCCWAHDAAYWGCHIPRWVAEADISMEEKLRIGRLIVDREFMECNMEAGIHHGVAALAFGAVQGYGADSYCPGRNEGPGSP